MDSSRIRLRSSGPSGEGESLVSLELSSCSEHGQRGRRIRFSIAESRRCRTAALLEFRAIAIFRSWLEVGGNRLNRDCKYAGAATEILNHLGSQLIRTGFRSPWQNGIAERWIGSCRQELLDHVIVLSENHLRRLIRDYIHYYHQDRIHDSLGKDTPGRRAIEPRRVTGSKVVAIPRLGGLHHRYTWHKAA
jgi:transposase InsO family protein